MRVFGGIFLILWALLGGGLAQVAEPLLVQEVAGTACPGIVQVLAPAFVPDVPVGTCIILLAPDLSSVRLLVEAQNDSALPTLPALLERRRLQGPLPTSLFFPEGSPIRFLSLEISLDLLQQFTLRDLIIARIGMDNYRRIVPSPGVVP